MTEKGNTITAIPTAEGVAYQIKRAKAPRNSLRGQPIETGDLYYRFYRIDHKKDKKLTFLGNINAEDILRCELCGVPIFKENKRFCCDGHGDTHLERSNKDFEGKMWDAGVSVSRL